MEPANAVRPGFDLTKQLKAKGVDELEMVRYGEGFFTSLGFEPLPTTFWERSLFTKPRDRDVVCHASAWDVDQKDDLRIKMCIEINEEDFSPSTTSSGTTTTSGLQRQVDALPRQRQRRLPRGARRHARAVGHAGLPEDLGLIDKEPPAEADIALQLKTALDKVAFLPFGLIIDKWRWEVFSGKIAAGRSTTRRGGS